MVKIKTLRYCQRRKRAKRTVVFEGIVVLYCLYSISKQMHHVGDLIMKASTFLSAF